MAAFTKLVIMRVFENLLSVKPLEKITVKDLQTSAAFHVIPSIIITRTFIRFLRHI